MKTFKFIIATVLLLAVSGVCRAQNLIHATYSVLSRIVPEELNPESQKDYAYHYLQAMPRWKAEDFDSSLEEIRARVDTHRYTRQETFDAYAKAIHEAGRKIYLSFSGGRFIDVAKDPARRMKFAHYMAAMAQHHGYDGLELDWEGTVTKPLHLEFIRDIRSALDSLEKVTGKHYGLTTALNCDHNYSAEEAAELSAHLDWINIMYYDMGGGTWGKKIGHNAPLSAIKSNYERNWSRFDPAKLHIGLASYGYYYEGLKPFDSVPEGHKMREYARDFFLTELPALKEKGWIEQWDDNAQCPWYVAPDGSACATADNERAIDAKLAWVNEKKFGGVFWWEYHCDYVPCKGHLLMDYVVGRISQPETTLP